MRATGGGRGEGAVFDLEAPVWWDPKVRRSIWDHTTFRLGMLLVDDDLVTVVTVRGIICAVRRDELRIEWPEVFELPMCDLLVGEERHRIYFCAPHPRAATFHARIPPAIAAVLETRGRERVRLAAARTPAARWPSQLTEPMGRKRMAAFRLLVDGTGDGSPAPEPERERSPVATSAPPDGMNDDPARGARDGSTAPFE